MISWNIDYQDGDIRKYLPCSVLLQYCQAHRTQFSVTRVCEPNICTIPYIHLLIGEHSFWVKLAIKYLISHYKRTVRKGHTGHVHFWSQVRALFSRQYVSVKRIGPKLQLKVNWIGRELNTQPSMECGHMIHKYMTRMEKQNGNDDSYICHVFANI
jgi:hypothetical protein